MSIFKFKKKKKKSKLKNIVNMLKYNKKLFLIVFLFILLITTTSIISLANFGGGQTENTPNLQRGLVGHWTMDENSYVEGTENLAENGDFQDGLTAWSTSAHNSSVYNYSVSVVDAPDAPFGDKALRVYRKYNEGENYGYLRIHNSYKNINEGETIVFHGWYKILEKGMGAPTLRFQYGGSTKRTVTADDSIIGQWQYLSGSYTVPEGEGGNYRVYVDYNHGRDGEVLWNAIQWERKSNPTPFVNGTRQTRLADSTPYGNHGTIAIENSPTLGSDRFGNDSGAVKFNGVNNFINIGSNNSIKPNKGTIVAWIKPHSIGGEQIILSRAGGGIVHRMPYFRLSGSNLAAMITNGVTSQSISYSAGLNENTWYQVAFFYDGNKTGFYINGEKVHELSQNFPASPSGSMRIGEFHPPDFSRPFNGIIDDIRIYNRALLPEEINLLYGSYKPQLQVSSLNSGLIGHWSLSEVDYNPLTFRVSDLTPYSNHGTNYGATFTSNRFGKEGGAMNFDGDSDYIELPHVSILNNLDGGVFGNSSWTTSFWINPERFGANNACGDDRAHIFGKGLIGGESYNSIRLTNNGTLSYITTHTGHSYSFGVSTSLLLNQFTNITLTHNSDTNQLLLYKNGLFVDSTNTDAGFGPGANGPLRIAGGYAIGCGQNTNFKGKIDDVRIYNRTLSEQEIEQLYNSYQPKITPSLQEGLVLDMPLTSVDYNSSTERVSDRSPYNNYGINNGAIISNDGAEFFNNNHINNEKKLNYVFYENNSWSISQWINYSSGFSYYPQFSKGHHSNGPGFTIHGVNVRIQGGDGILNGYDKHNMFKEDLRGKGWKNTVITYNGSVFKAYLDGELKDSLNWTYGIGDTSNYNLYFGRFWGPYGEIKMSNIRIYNRALSPEEVQLLYSRGR